MGFKLKNDAEAYGFQNFVKEMFFDSETNMVVISGVPGKEIQRDDGRQGAGRRGSARRRSASPAELADVEQQERDQRPGRLQRALCQGNLAPNHYWDKATNTHRQGRPVRADGARGQDLRIDSWKWYCHTDPGRTGNGFQLDDEKLTVRSTRSRASAA